MRWYGERLEVAERPSLERKLKRGMVSGKEAHSIPPFAMNGVGIRSLLETAFDLAVFPPVFRSALQLLEPALFNRYHRHYFLSGDGRFRLTVDSNLQFASLPLDHPSAIAPMSPALTLIIELKFQPELAEYAEAITNALPFRMSRFSKYVTGIERL